MKPLIGITTHVELDYKHVLNHDYIIAVQRAGGIPLLIPIDTENDAGRILDALDGLVVSGGGDIDPTLFGEEPHPKLGEISPGRDASELALIKGALERDMPLLTICRGLQIMVIAEGGDMYQDIYSQIDRQLLQHSQRANRVHLSHFVETAEGSILREAAQAEKFRVNSYHHQAVRDVKAPFAVSGIASDGVIEAVESTEHRFAVGVQWHPEALAAAGDGPSLRLFERFIETAKEGAGTLANH
ncbi:gamma-glutamyl-gamma-aminobutyrate hydrolase family protein [Bhargavaea beijingensis]|uniref:Gamma-glutamyl-gamma-aminobutyrate hydrolase family protein n=1 Tax=Bhargavaea beijingensis TaxID=426756 RepID=A0ABX9ZE15_9BACL|nr:gamma-glutamyl-gamma-aminobutyrate hydrolase family protein [Bhargavaea beijingensis]RSK34328.1 gamma-glutamyl-gamma-aminobutyrate hydrolase family protein [Bhargavaea beijingensis]